MISSLLHERGAKALVPRGLTSSGEDRFLFLLGEERQGLDIIGGRLKDGESSLETLARELWEEGTQKLVDKPAPRLLAEQLIIIEGLRTVEREIFLAHSLGEVALSREHRAYEDLTLGEALDRPNLDPTIRHLLRQPSLLDEGVTRCTITLSPNPES